MNFEYVKPIKLDSSKQRIFFTSDLHFGHKNILKYYNRPWDSVEDMEEGLIKNWNSVVTDDDIVFDLGDFAFATHRKWKEILGELNGQHHLILGNHDIQRWPGDKIMELFDSVNNQLLLKIDERYVYLNHYPYLCYGGSYRGPETAVYQLFGHVHNSPYGIGKDINRLNNLFPYQYDVGVDNNNYTPISWEDVCKKIENQIINGIPEFKETHTLPEIVYTE